MAFVIRRSVLDLPDGRSTQFEHYRESASRRHSIQSTRHRQVKTLPRIEAICVFRKKLPERSILSKLSSHQWATKGGHDPGVESIARYLPCEISSARQQRSVLKCQPLFDYDIPAIARLEFSQSHLARPN